jgi:L-ribulose-5-phosphate 3-epimerase
MIHRRQVLKSLGYLGVGAFAGAKFTCPPKLPRRFNIGACDWSLGKAADVGAFDLAAQIGLDGIQVSLGSVADQFHLRRPEVQQQFLEASKRTGVRIASLAIAELNNYPYKSDPQTEQWVSDSIDVAKALGVTVVLLAFFVKNDLRKDPAGIAETVERLKRVAPKAEKAGVILGLETYLSAEEHLDILKRVGSPAVKVYYDFRNTADAGYDIYTDVKKIGKKRICELHIKENGLLLGQGSIDWPRVRRSLDEMDYAGGGWMQIEWAMPKDGNVVECYRHNLTYLREIFA